MNAPLNKAIRAPECYTERKFQWGIDIGTRTCQELSGSADECLHAASHMMAYLLRIMEKERMNLLVKHMVVHSTVRRSGHHDDELEESIKTQSKTFGTKGNNTLV
jgi:hypothetical protein